MKITYTGEGASVEEPKVWDYKPSRLLMAEAEAIEKVSGLDYGSEFSKKLMSGNMHALHALIWVLRKRSEANLRYADVTFCLADVSMGFDDEELDGIAKRLDYAKTDEERDAVQALLDAEGYTPPEPDPTTAGAPASA